MIYWPAVNVALVFALCGLIAAVMAGFISAATTSGPNCPAPVPADWLGFCADYEVK